MKKVAIGLVVALLLVSLIGIGSVSAVSYKDEEIVVNFDDLNATKVPDGKLSLGYAGIAWDTDWMIWNSPQAYYAAHSGDTRIHSHNFGGWINFSHDVEFKGAWIAGQPIGQISFEGYNDGVFVGNSSMVRAFATPRFLNANFPGLVDSVLVNDTEYNFFCMDDVTYAEKSLVGDLDIRPGEYPNKLNRNAGNNIPVAIVGEADLDVATIDATSVTLEGLVPVSWAITDVCSPSGASGADGYPDLVFQFENRGVAAIPKVQSAAKGTTVALTITGTLTSGIPLEGTDDVFISDVGSTALVKKTTTTRISTKR